MRGFRSKQVRETPHFAPLRMSLFLRLKLFAISNDGSHLINDIENILLQTSNQRRMEATYQAADYRKTETKYFESTYKVNFSLLLLQVKG